MTISFLRHNSFFGPEDSNDYTLNIIGVGATGSWVGLLAAKMGWHNFQIWDLDIVESHNCPNQIYNSTQIGMKKVDAFEEVLKSFNPNINIIKHPHFFDPKEGHLDLLEDFCFLAVDTLSARQTIVSEILSSNKLDDLHLLFETKMGFNHAELNIFSSLDTNKLLNYLKCLKTDIEVRESACNERIITTLTNIVASTLVHNLCDYTSSIRRNNPFSIQNKIIFNLSEKLNIYSV